MFTDAERSILRELAQKQLEAAHSSKNLERVALWKRHNALKGERPVLHIEINTFEDEVIGPRLKCADPVAREIEARLWRSMINLTEFDDDKVVPDYYGISQEYDYQPLGFEIRMHHAADGGLGHQFEHQISDLKEEFSKLGTSRFIPRDAAFHAHFDAAQDVIGDILPVRRVMPSLYATPTQDIVHIMGLENMLYALYDYPEELRQMIERIADGYIAHFDMLEKNGLLLPTTGFEETNQGSLSFTDELPHEGPVTVGQVWGFMDSQETVGVSKEMFEELIFPAYYPRGVALRAAVVRMLRAGRPGVGVAQPLSKPEKGFCIRMGRRGENGRVPCGEQDHLPAKAEPELPRRRNNVRRRRLACAYRTNAALREGLQARVHRARRVHDQQRYRQGLPRGRDHARVDCTAVERVTAAGASAKKKIPASEIYGRGDFLKAQIAEFRRRHGQVFAERACKV